MRLLGKSNWWFPASLDRRLPRLGIDPDSVIAGVAEPVAATPTTEPAASRSASVEVGARKRRPRRRLV
jgi:hypothetical protein